MGKSSTIFFDKQSQYPTLHCVAILNEVHRKYIYDVRCFGGIFDLPTYPNQILYYISLCSEIRCSLTYLPTQKSDVIYECSLTYCLKPCLILDIGGLEIFLGFSYSNFDCEAKAKSCMVGKNCSWSKTKKFANFKIFA